MKTIYKYLFTLLAAFTFAPTGWADEDPAKDLVLTKSIKADPANERHILTLESYLKGSADAKPVDIVLVLDVSGSMKNPMGSSTRIQSLKTAVNSFITVMDCNDEFVDWYNGSKASIKRSSRLGNRISIVKFADDDYGSVKNGSRWYDVDESDLHECQYTSSKQSYYAYNDYDYNCTQLVKNLTTLSSDNSVLTKAVGNLAPTGATAANFGLTKAKYVFDAVENSQKAPFNNKVVVFFTDGAPTYFREFNSGVAGAAINVAKALKDNGAVVYSVGVFEQSNPGSQINSYMNSVSSNYPNAKADNVSLPSSGSDRGGSSTYTSHPEGPDKSGYYMTASSPEDLNSIFIKIAEAAAARTDVTQETAVQDFVTKSFKLPAGNLGIVNVYTYDCNGVDSDGNFTWNNKTSWASSNNASDKDKISISTVNGEKKVNVTGFNYSLNWVGIHGDGSYKGKKLSIEIPIEVKDEVVGGNATLTNNDKSGIILPGETDPVATFTSQQVDIPINLWIKKYGLQRGESAKFKIYRKKMKSSEEWQEYTSIVISGTGEVSDGNEMKDKGLDYDAAYIGKLTSPMAKLEGLDGSYYYKVEEESWSWTYTSECKTAFSTDPADENKLEFNPVIFVNTKGNPSRKNAESVVTNKFIAGEDPVTVDSRDFK